MCYLRGDRDLGATVDRNPELARVGCWMVIALLIGAPRNRVWRRKQNLKMCDSYRFSTMFIALAVGFSIDSGTGIFVSASHAEVIFHDDFSNGDLLDREPVTWEPLPGAEDAGYDVSSGDLKAGKTTEDVAPILFAQVSEQDVSIRTQVLMENSTIPALIEIGARADLSERFDLVVGRLIVLSDEIRAAIYDECCVDWGQEDDWVESPVDPRQSDLVLQLDVFDSTASFWVWNAGDRQPDAPLLSLDDVFTETGQVGLAYDEDSSSGDALLRYFRVEDSPIEDLPGDFNADWTLTVDDVDQLMTAIRTGESVPLMDLDTKSLVDTEDLRIWVRDLRETWFGDANLDGEFNSGDLVAVFEAGKYEDELGATWAEGDWNADGLFDSGDLVRAFDDGGYDQGPVVAAVPEPSALSLVAVALAGLAFLGRGNWATTHDRRVAS